MFFINSSSISQRDRRDVGIYFFLILQENGSKIFVKATPTDCLYMIYLNIIKIIKIRQKSHIISFQFFTRL